MTDKHKFCRLLLGKALVAADDAGLRPLRLIAVPIDDTTLYSVYADGDHIWTGKACCKWDAKRKAFEKPLREST